MAFAITEYNYLPHTRSLGQFSGELMFGWKNEKNTKGYPLLFFQIFVKISLSPNIPEINISSIYKHPEPIFRS